MDLEPLDPAYVRARLAQAPFVVVPGVVNVRDLGGYPSSSPGLVTKPRLLFRSGELSYINDEGRAVLRDFGVDTVYDLRSDTEIEKYNTPCPIIEGVEVIRTPVFKLEDYSPEMMAKRFELYASGKTEAFMELYSQILDHAGPAFSIIFRHIRDRPDSPVVFHCTAGKDRTGVLAALLLMLAGVDDDMIAEDYALTRIGREPVRELVMARLAKIPLFSANNEAALNMLTSRKEIMLAFLDLIRKKYGGAEDYLRTYTLLTDDDIATIRRNILTPQSSVPAAFHYSKS